MKTLRPSAAMATPLGRRNFAEVAGPSAKPPWDPGIQGSSVQGGFWHGVVGLGFGWFWEGCNGLTAEEERGVMVRVVRSMRLKRPVPDVTYALCPPGVMAMPRTLESSVASRIRVLSWSPCTHTGHGSVVSICPTHSPGIIEMDTAATSNKLHPLQFEPTRPACPEPRAGVEMRLPA